ncbi:hypothetical protein DPMN_164011 [Dreissena polymorpha]|uniref:Uncharacterized protein n=1 Tax=Dreissena polymorpha TaxID=45954 RepID=A0A9D4ITC4_DREPO|nr:hypothetical protein DPMN_164011 [Dreissena polymorpha]
MDHQQVLCQANQASIIHQIEDYEMRIERKHGHRKQLSAIGKCNKESGMSMEGIPKVQLHVVVDNTLILVRAQTAGKISFKCRRPMTFSLINRP